MAKVILDFTEARQFDNTPLPPGFYNAVIDATPAEEIRVSRDSGTPYFTLAFEITDPEEYRGRRVFANFMISGPGAGITQRMLANLGLWSEEMGLQPEFDTRVLHGIAVRIRVRENKRPDGTVGNNVTQVLPALSD
ncbi:MAG: hypothetical protein AB7V08_14850 [Elusimicrobiales bacterium]